MDLLKHLSDDVIILTFIRNPYERVLSHIKHICAIDQTFNNDPNLVIQKKLSHILHVQSRMLRYHPINKLGFQKMEGNVKRINFIGITEEFEKSIALCNKMFDWKLETISPQNQRPSEILNQLSPKNKNLVIQRLIPEIRVFRTTYDKYQRLCDEYEV